MNEKALEAACKAVQTASHWSYHEKDIRAAIEAYERASAPVVNWENSEDPVVKLMVQFPVHEYVAAYEYGDHGYSPNEWESDLIIDAIYGALSDVHEKLRGIFPLPSAPEEREDG